MNTKMETIENYRIGGPQASLFEQKLREHTGWAHPFCQDAIKEYKRFAYLASTSQSELSPSKVVDEVWHLHLTFSRDYWTEWCPNVLSCNVHHNPGMPDDRERMRDQYRETLREYVREFQQLPSEKFWPAEHPRPTKNREVRIAAAVALSAFTAVGAVASEADSDGGSSFWFWVFFAVVGYFVISPLFKSRRHGKRGSTSSSFGFGGCSSSNDSGSSDGGGSSCGGGCGGCGG